MSNTSGGDIFEYIVSGDRGSSYKVKFQWYPYKLIVFCTCGRSTGSDYTCRHARYVLSGKISKITGGDISRLEELIEKVKSIDKEKVAKAQHQYRDDNHCRRCNSENIVKIKNSLFARLRLILRDQNHTFYCKSCNWSW